MRKLMKTKTRDQEHVRSSSPQLGSESCEGLDDLRCHDNGSFMGSQGSEESASNSLNGDTLSPKRSSSEYLLNYFKPSASHCSRQEHPETSHSDHRPFFPTSQSQKWESRIFCSRQLSWIKKAKYRYTKSPFLFRKLLKLHSPKARFRHVELQEESSDS